MHIYSSPGHHQYCILKTYEIRDLFSSLYSTSSAYLLTHSKASKKYFWSLKNWDRKKKRNNGRIARLYLLEKCCIWSLRLLKFIDLFKNRALCSLSLYLSRHHPIHLFLSFNSIQSIVHWFWLTTKGILIFTFVPNHCIKCYTTMLNITYFLWEFLVIF